MPHVAHGDHYVPDEIPVLAIHVRHTDGHEVALRLPYQAFKKGSIRVGELRVVSTEALPAISSPN